MKLIKSLLAAVLIACGLLTMPLITGCGTPTAKVTQVAGTVTTTVDAAMKSWGDFVRAGKAPVEDRIKVRSAYIKYQQAMQASEMAAISALNAPETQPAYVTALNAAAAASTDLVALIESLTKK